MFVSSWKRAFEELVSSQQLSGTLDSEAFRLGFLAGRAWRAESVRADEFTVDELAVIKTGVNKLRVMKMVRDRVGCHIKEAKVVVDAVWPAEPCCNWHGKGGLIGIECGDDIPNSAEFRQ